ncbi:NUDIX domain-containing protein [Microbacterium sp. C7(2022)]|uniref:NUDIX hydrolase n=1 Tax=Microbacterium sp. C7(2022) TaxID=2992759 RepID=UPI00237BAE19|nr:NUDIX hydrolase [Microbacterium sp. C7(2022)]MDE0546421.1 NUDIX hydrolase [Microbacterium sp. C7(2022)]
MSADELWDLRDIRGKLVGRTHARGAADWPDGAFHAVAGTVAVRRDGLVLMTLRSSMKDHPLTWEFPAGSALAGESSLDAAVRELREETGLSIDADSMVAVGRFIETRALFDLFVTRLGDHADLVLDGDEVAEAEWVAVEEACRRWRAGLMAAPWESRLAQLWPRLAEVIDQSR